MLAASGFVRRVAAMREQDSGSALVAAGTPCHLIRRCRGQGDRRETSPRAIENLEMLMDFIFK